MRILILSPRQCWPPVSGAKLREYFLARALGRRNTLTHASFQPTGAPPLTAAELPFCHRVVSVPLPRQYTPGKIVRGLLGRTPLPILNYTSPGMFAALSELVRHERFDLVQMESIHMAGYAPMLSQLTGAAVVYDWHNIESEAMRRYGLHVQSPWRGWYAKHTAGRLASFEDRILREAFGHLVCSERERSQLLQLAPRARIAVIENGVDASHFDQDGAATVARRKIVFVGQMSYHANIEAVVAFTKSIWPRVRSQFPDWILSIVGSDPAPAVLELRQIANVEVTGTVADVRPYYRDAVAAIVPLRIGGGTRLKILEAMAAGVPVVSSALGAEGLAVSPGTDILIAGSAEEWVAHLTALAADQALWASLSEAGRKLVIARYDWSILGETLAVAYRTWLPGADQ